jgi:hypothetical protein
MSEHVSTPYSVYGGRDPNDIRRDLIREMNRLGVYSLDGQYSGGHDEGGLDQLTLYNKAGDVIEGELKYDHPLHQAVEDLLSTKFYSWALECSVYGHVYVDLRKKRAWTEGSEEVMEYKDDADPIDMRW